MIINTLSIVDIFSLFDKNGLYSSYKCNTESLDRSSHPSELENEIPPNILLYHD